MLGQNDRRNLFTCEAMSPEQSPLFLFVVGVKFYSTSDNNSYPGIYEASKRDA